MKTLIIPDVHQDIPWVENILKTEKGNFDEVIFLGDYFDAFKEKVTIVKTLSYLKELAKSKNYYFLLGNHDLAYLELLNLKGLRARLTCGGVTSQKLELLRNSDFNEFVSNNCRLFIRRDVGKIPIVFTHAGIHPHILLRNRLTTFEKLCAKALNAILNGNLGLDLKYLVGAGLVRGGDQSYGGITWCDFSEFYYADFTDKFVQIFGHTGKTELARISNGNHACIDGNQTIYAILDGVALTIKNINSAKFRVSIDLQTPEETTEFKTKLTISGVEKK